jgi:uncharacterized protein (TIGR03437 family)
VVTRSVYTGTANTVTIGQALPPICPSTGACGAAPVANGSFPSATNSNNVFNNDTPDGSFGVTSPIFLDQLSPSGTLINTMAIPPNLETTSFSSNSPQVISFANVGGQTVAPGSLVAANGQGTMSGFLGPIFGIYPLQFGGTSVSVIDSTGANTTAPLFFVSPNEVDFQIPSSAATGTAQIVITSNGGSQTAGNVQIAAVSPGLFTLNNSGLATGYALRVSSSVYTTTSSGAVMPSPINMGAATDQVYLILYGIATEAAGTANTTVTVNGANATVLYAGAQGGSPGLDQVNILLPSSLAGKGDVNVQLTAKGTAANPVQITIQ